MAGKRDRPEPRVPARWGVYILRCGDGSLYTGATTDLPRRFARHSAGKGAAYTRSRLPLKLVFFEKAEDRSSALKREAALKKLTRKMKLALLRVAGRQRLPRLQDSKAAKKNVESTCPEETTLSSASIVGHEPDRKIH